MGNMSKTAVAGGSDLYATVDFSKKKSKKSNGSKNSGELSLRNSLSREKPRNKNNFEINATVDLNRDRAKMSFYNHKEDKTPEISQINDLTNKDLLKRGHTQNQYVCDQTSVCPKKYHLNYSGYKWSVCVLLTLFLIGTLTMILTAIIITLYNKVSVLERLNEGNFENLQKNYSNFHNEYQDFDKKLEPAFVSLLNLNMSMNHITDSLNTLSLEVERNALILRNFHFSSCYDAARLNFYASGNYIVRSSTGVLWSVYCDMNRTFGGNSTGWMSVAELDVNNCPPGLRLQIINSDNTCVVIEDNAGCTEIIYPVYNTTYTRITGQIRGYQIRTSDSFVSVGSLQRPKNFTDLNNNYLDGVSISTNGQHVWSFAAGCNCLNTPNKPTIIGQDYTCDGVAVSGDYSKLLWASQQCRRNSTWFYKTLPPTTTDIKVRICRDENRMDEDLAIKTLELYTQLH